MMFYLRTLVKAIPLLLPLIPALYLQRYLLPVTVTYLGVFLVVEYFAIYRPEKAFEAKRRRLMNAFFQSGWRDQNMKRSGPASGSMSCLQGGTGLATISSRFTSMA